ncbi:sodium-dependent transporter [Aquisalimonas asiatica]|uniref:Transporter n=1 Tax=Aquisalimonas asiatica TaxID=406100 RepID=A0A1H8QEE8_9GAMM|nr:sodium-dependent transporter [Aquisalimonas asiatica]SEO52264.1 neurotransmitter:Na+ symporter, NSS family [Aquisalimonas asiatica]
MSETRSSLHGEWSSGMIFVLAATGSAVGLGNLWRFPYLVGENGGAAFVIIYLLCILLVGLPIMIAEITLGRRGKRSPINSLRSVALEEGRSANWALLGWLGVAAGFLILSFYSVVGGWALSYVLQSLLGTFQGITSDSSTHLFETLVASPFSVLGWHTLFMLLLFGIVAMGVRKGLQRAVTILMPLLFVLLILLVGYGMAASGAFQEAMAFMFQPDFSAVEGGTVLTAMGQAFFTLSLGMGAIMVYGAYLPKHESIPHSAGWIVGMDTITAILAGLAIFPIVFAVGLEPGEGAGLVFITLPIVFGEIPFGYLLGLLFFVLLSVAAITSGMSLLEPATSYLTERRRDGSRLKAAAIISSLIWLLGVACGLSLNALSGITVLPGMNIFDSLEYISNDIMLPLGGLLIAIFVGWRMRLSSVVGELGVNENGALFKLWLVVTRFVAPAAVILVFANATGLFELFG